MALARGSATLNAPSGCFSRVFLVNTRNTPAGGTQRRRQAVLPERKKGTIRCQPPKSTRPKTTHSPGRRLHAETLYKQAGKRAEGSPEGAWLWRAGARLSMPPLVVSFGYFLSIQEIPPPEAPSCDDKQCRQNVERERFGASSKTPSQSPAGQFTFCTSKKIHLRLQSLCQKSPKGFSDSLKRTLRFSARSFCYRLVRRGRGAGRDFPGRSPWRSIAASVSRKQVSHSDAVRCISRP